MNKYINYTHCSLNYPTFCSLKKASNLQPPLTSNHCSTSMTNLGVNKLTTKKKQKSVYLHKLAKQLRSIKFKYFQ